MPRREAQQLVRAQGGQVAERIDAQVDLIVVGENELLSPDGLTDELVDRLARERVEAGELEIITETELWQRLGLVEAHQSVRRLYTPAMLADLLGLPVAVIRRWHRRGLIVPAREVRRLAYFDFQEVATARQLAELLATGISPAALERKLADLARLVPGVKRPLAQLSVIVEGKQFLLRQGDGLIDSKGQLRFDFAALGTAGGDPSPLASPDNHEILSLPERRAQAELPSADEMFELAGEFEDLGQLESAADMYRAAMAAGGPTVDGCFRLAELLYQLDDLSGDSRTLLHRDRAGRELRRSPGQPGLRVGRDRAARIGGGRVRGRRSATTEITPTCTITWPARSTTCCVPTTRCSTGPHSSSWRPTAPGPKKPAAGSSDKRNADAARRLRNSAGVGARRRGFPLTQRSQLQEIDQNVIATAG